MATFQRCGTPVPGETPRSPELVRDGGRPDRLKEIACMLDIQTLDWALGRLKTRGQMGIVAAHVTSITAFPRSAVESSLRAELIDVVKADASIKGVSLPTKLEDIVDAAMPIDSLVVVCILCSIEPIIGFELPETVVRAGGYPSVRSALTHLMANIEKQWVKRKGAKP